jgi:hypothetical protein
MTYYCYSGISLPLNGKKLGTIWYDSYLIFHQKQSLKPAHFSEPYH